jgi:hypothetical protein
MTWLIDKMKWIMLVSGVLTCTMLYAAFAPQAALQSTFGEELTGPVAEIVVRNWGALIGLIGAMLIYGAFDIKSRPLVLVVASVSKVVFIGLIVVLGQRFMSRAAVPIAVDSLMVVLFALYLIATRSK